MSVFKVSNVLNEERIHQLFPFLSRIEEHLWEIWEPCMSWRAHICCTLCAGHQHCYRGPNLIFSVFWSSTFNHGLLGRIGFPREIVWENVISACLWNHTFKERALAKTKMQPCALRRETYGGWIVGWKPQHNCTQPQHSKLPISISSNVGLPRQLLMISVARGLWVEFVCVCVCVCVCVGRGGQPPQTRLKFPWISITVLLNHYFQYKLNKDAPKVTKARFCWARWLNGFKALKPLGQVG